MTANHKFKLPVFLVISSHNDMLVGCTNDCQSLTSNVTQKYHQTNKTIKLPKFHFNCTSHATYGQHDPFLVRTTTSPWPTSCKQFQFHTPSQPFGVMFVSTNFHRMFMESHVRLFRFSSGRCAMILNLLAAVYAIDAFGEIYEALP